MAISLIDEFRKRWLTSVIGICIFGAGVYLLTWNEGRAVHHHHSLEEVFQNAISLNQYDKLRPEFDGRVVHIAGDLVVDEPLTDPEYGISIQAVKLKRRVQMYQWVEERSPRNDGDDIVQQKSENDYYYVTEWRDKLVDSSTFYIRHGHRNPREMPLKTVTYIAPYVQVGALKLGAEIKDKFIDFTEVSSDERPERRDIKLHMGIYYHCQDVWNPEVGDIRVQFYYAGMAGEPVTVIAQQQHDILIPYHSSRGRDIALLRYGNLDVSQMSNFEHSDARWETWTFRFYGCFFVYCSTLCLSWLLKALYVSVSNLHNFTGEAVDCNNFMVAGSASLLIIASAWISHRPVIGVSLVFTAISPFLYCIMGVYNAAQNGFGLRS
ncbi:transmembrane protein 43 homolog [Cylas formicarius]|uniref:transmembrane protein 43 homolog n=1 Tax=Cylas formicarius TaxID=197179 RepID=UPI002958830F|nr:transmembrane protein 43 homolog [Cylas formicarius]